MIHKIIFFLLVFLEFIGLLALAQDFPLKFVDSIGMFLELLAIFGLYSFIYHKTYFSKKTWKVIFYIISFFWAIELLDLVFLDGAITNSLPNFLQSGLDYSKSMLMFGLILQAYFLYIIYQLSQGKKLKK